MIPDKIKNLYIPDISAEGCDSSGGVSFYEYLTGIGEGQFAALEAIRLYEMCFPLSNAIDKRARAFKGLPIKLYDKKADQFITQGHELLELINQPNAADDEDGFLEQLASYYDITGNVICTGTYANGVDRPPLEIMVRSPAMASIFASRGMGTSGYAGRYTLTPSLSPAETYELDDNQRKFRYIESVRGEGLRDLIHIKRFKASKGENIPLWGQSRARSITLEIQQYIEGNKTNYGTLQNGIRPSGAFVGNTGTELTEAQWNRLKELGKSYAGAKGAGRVFIADGVDFKPMNMSNRDMEYRDLRKDMELSINQRYDIPAANVSDGALTYNNLSTSEYLFYHDSVLPLADTLLAALTTWLIPKYKNSENLMLCYDRAEIPALALKAFEEAEALRKAQVNTDNEIRTVLGYEPLDSDIGDIVYKPANVLPAQDLVNYSASILTANDGLKSYGLERFVNSMMLEVNQATGKHYSRDEALALAKKHGIR